MCPECTADALRRASEHNAAFQARVDAGLPLRDEYGVYGPVGPAGTYVPCVHQQAEGEDVV